MDIYEEADNAKTQEDFLRFLKKLIENLKDKPEEWDNDDLISFLSGFEGYCFDTSINELTWKDLARTLLAARVYE